MNRLSRERRSHVLRALVEGTTIRATCRLTGTAKGAVLSLSEDAGAACLDYQDRTLRNLSCHHLQCDEISERRYSSAECIGADIRCINGKT